MIEEYLTVGIATKNRHEELQVTLNQLRAGSLRDCQIIVVDDGSTPAIEIPKNIDNVILIRHHESQDVACSRNEIARTVRTPFWLTLDDDSYPVEVDIEALIRLLQGSTDVIAISCPFKEQFEGSWKWLNPSLKTDVYPVRTFVACSGIINVRRFMEVGGYSDWVYQFGEESDLSLRAYKAGYPTIHSSIMKVQHNKVNVARSMDRIDYYGARNQVLMALYYLPIRYFPLRFAKLVIHHTRCLLRHGRYKGVVGIFCGLIEGGCKLSQRKGNVLTSAEFRKYRELDAS
tara:strand:+ start:1964 stop:2827 length:864 start_codon:yes stop_codon:yes gene_type:complete